MSTFKQFLIETNTHNEDTLNAAWEKAWTKHGADILDNVKDMVHDPHTKTSVPRSSLNDLNGRLHPLAAHYDKETTREYLNNDPDTKRLEIGYHTSHKAKPNQKNLRTPAEFIKWDLGEHVKNAVRNNYEPQEWSENEPSGSSEDGMSEWDVEYNPIKQTTMRERPEYRDKNLDVPSTTMPGSHPKYINWITQQLKQGSIKRLEDLNTTIRDHLEKYDHLKRHDLLRDDITNNPRAKNPRNPYHFDEERDEPSMHPPLQKRDGSWQYDSHKTADFNNFSVANLRELVNHPVYADYFSGPTHEQAMSKLKEGHDYDVIHDSTPGGPHRDKLTPEEQQQKRGVKVFHVKTEAAAHALAICPGTNKRTEWCTGIPGQHNGNEAFRDYNKAGPILVLHGEPGGPNMALTTNHQESRFHDDAPVMRQVHIPSQQWMNEHDEHDQHTMFDADQMGPAGRMHVQFPSFDGGDVKAFSHRHIARDVVKYEETLHAGHHMDGNQYLNDHLNEHGRAIQEEWHLHKQFGYHPEAVANNKRSGIDYVESKRRNLAAAGTDRYIDTMQRIEKFADFDKEKSDNMDAMFGPGGGSNRSNLIRDPSISHTTKHLIAKYGSDDDVAHLVANHVKSGGGGYTSQPLHELDTDTIKAVMRRYDGRVGDLAAKGSSNRPTSIQVAKGRVVAKIKQDPNHPLHDWLGSNHFQYTRYNDLPIDSGSR